MSVVIVTKKCYLICERVNYITIEEECLDMNRADKFGTRSKNISVPYWNIHIDFEPFIPQNSNSPRSRSDESSVMVKVGDKDIAYKLFSEIVNQIREQIPDQLFLDRLAREFLTEGALDESSFNGKYEELYNAGTKKRRSKKVLPRSKRGNRKRR